MRKILAAKTAALAVMLGVVMSAGAQGIPVIDATNIAQATVSAIQNVAAVEKQIQQYETQLQQYQNMLQNTLAPAAWVWDQANQTISKLLAAQDVLTQFKSQTGSLDQYLSRYEDVSYYRSSPCFTSSGCTNAQRQALIDAQANGSSSVKAANDAVLKGVDQQQQTLTADAANLRSLQSQATSATGQMQAIQAANQLASAQANQLLQIRGLLVAQQAAEATRAQVAADREAQQMAASSQFLGGTSKRSSDKQW
ncbi:P-type conjugative transfer protein TrbJ [Burkholderia sp. Bp9004]|uniref:P-type conjugative transfer protein TrbJ n=1 Tax=Burkholderia sp. Bp9004 TaxID=2184559 RepID=UPI000F5DC004|nr:P-type conjugative transfer protein TrbJ [Burkholderia sp. Bp9004]RQZ67267.1 P-type conjugative transfer protein TrbJ [Burkholderia sp. Bp9004]